MSKRRQYAKRSKEILKNVLEDHRGDFVLKCERQFYIPKVTLERHMDNKNKRANDGIDKMGTFVVFPKNIENELVKHLLALEENMFGMTVRDWLLKLQIKTALKTTSTEAHGGKKGCYGFMGRHAFNKSRVDIFFPFKKHER
ncbi:hypothetical protein JTB14_035461 [Gonioctena quinquepunctata]|nr:hypothetical protein JTB14_035461 [Gonioctena quinquepunctata]